MLLNFSPFFPVAVVRTVLRISGFQGFGMKENGMTIVTLDREVINLHFIHLFLEVDMKIKTLVIALVVLIGTFFSTAQITNGYYHYFLCSMGYKWCHTPSEVSGKVNGDPYCSKDGMGFCTVAYIDCGPGGAGDKCWYIDPVYLNILYYNNDETATYWNS